MVKWVRPAPEVDQPTYDIVGPVERFDMRDEASVRVHLRPGTPDYEEYYARRPENKEWDDELRRIRARAYENNWGKDPINEQFLPSVFYSMAVQGQPSVVDGTIANFRRPGGLEKELNLDPVEMARKIKEYAIYLGAATARVAKLKQEWIYSHYAHTIGSGFQGKPIDDMDYENIICMPILHDRRMKNIGRGAFSETEDGWRYTYASLVSVIIAQFIRYAGYRARPLPSTSAPYFAVPPFVDAGIGEQGRHSFVVSKDIGCNWRPAAVVTDMPLAINKPVDFGLQDFCETCQICAEYCPSGSISKGGRVVVRGVRRWDFNSHTCRRYWEQLGHSCGICQAVCPWNHPNSLLHDGIREISQRFPFLRKAIVRGEKLLYPYTPAKPPDWMTTPGYFKET